MPDTETTIETVSVTDAETNTTPTDATHDVTDTENASADCGAQVDALIAETQALNDKYLRLAAELENTRRRSALDCESAARNRAMSVAGHFLPVMDAIAAALTHSPDDAGIQSMARAMESAFAQVGIVKIESVGQPLNPQFHNAIQVMAAPADMTPPPAPNTVITEMQAGYMFGDSVLRPAMVVVSK
ncbi:MAG: nucleotide exchange factor GrpE [Alphaproteobacteria bacterium]|nr:nucleotide exchange factor GrpE [Alphaproteobacteria bacterium]